MSETSDQKKTRPQGRRLLLTLAGVALGMFGFGFALVPLYDIFCEVTGIRLIDNGRVSASEVQFEQIDEERWVTVHFDAAVDRGLPWDFGPSEKFMKVKVGEVSETLYLARNQSTEAVIGHAVPSVAPAPASIYFAKTECFCFTQQRLEAGESQEMPVRFVIDPALPKNTKVLTLSYRFYKYDEESGTLAKADRS